MIWCPKHSAQIIGASVLSNDEKFLDAKGIIFGCRNSINRRPGNSAATKHSGTISLVQMILS